MGHQRTGRLPKTHRWREVVALLDTAPHQTAAIAAKIAHAAEGRLRRLSNDPSLVDAFWFLTRLTWAARGPDFAGAVAQLGVQVAPTDATLTFIARVADALRPELSRHLESGPFSELASLALRRALSETVGEATPSLFGSSVADVQLAFRDYSTKPRFGALAQRFFGDFLARTLRHYVDKELANHVGVGHSLQTVAEAGEFKQALDRHARQSAGIMRDFAADWYSKHNWESRGEISRDEAGRFVHHAVRKLRRELQLEAART